MADKNEPVNIVPFGKYRGQPLEVMSQDKQYVDWLMQQPWFQANHAPIYNLIVNNFGEPSETPEHNALQARFLDDGFCLAFLLVEAPTMYRQLANGWAKDARNRIVNVDRKLTDAIKSLAREQENIETMSPDVPWYKTYLYEAERRRQEIAELTADGSRDREWLLRPALDFSFRPQFEWGGIDVHLEFSIRTAVGGGGERIAGFSNYADIECKPRVGDDYPAVLRQMDRQSSRLLLLGRYDGIGATFEQVVRIFGNSGKRIVRLNDVEAELPQARSMLESYVADLES